MRYLWQILMVFSLPGIAVATHTYILHTPSTTGAYTFDVKNNDVQLLYEVRTRGTSVEQPFGTTTDLALGLPKKSLLSYSTGVVQKFFSSGVKVALNGDTATIKSEVNDEIHPTNSRRNETTITLLKGSTGFVVWDPLLLPEMLSDGKNGPMTCIFDGGGFPLVVRSLTFRPHGVPQSATGIAATCGRAGAEIWYDPRSRLTLWAKSIDSGNTWQIER